MSLLLRLTLFGACVALASHAYAASGSPVGQIKAPCDDVPGTTSGLRPCQTVLRSPTGTITLLRKRINDYLGNLYAGLEKDALDPTAVSNFGPTLCNLVPGEFNPSSEILTANSGGASCGIPMKVEINGRKVILHTTQQQGKSREEGYMRGAYPAALGCFYKAAVAELDTDKGITPHASCEALARDILQLGTDASGVAEQLKSQLADQKNLGDIINCITPVASPSPGTSDKGEVDVGGLRQSAQQLCAARLAIESMFSQLVACNVFARAGNAYQNLVSRNGSFTQIMKLTETKIFPTCVRQCRNQNQESALPQPQVITVPGTPPRTTTINPPLNSVNETTKKTSIEACAQSCYERELPKEFRKLFEANWPGNPSSLSSCREN